MLYVCGRKNKNTHTKKWGGDKKSLPPSLSLPARLPAVFKITLIKITVNNYKPRVYYLVLI